MTGIAQSEVLDLLTALVEKSLVVYEEDARGGRYRMLEMVRQYAEPLVDATEVARLRGRHIDWYLDLAKTAEPQLAGPEQGAWLSRLETEQGNYRSALEWSLNFRSKDGLELAKILALYWRKRGHFAEGREWLERALVEGDGEQLPTVASTESALVLALATVRADALVRLAFLTIRQGDYQNAASYAQESLNLSERVGYQKGMGYALNHLGVTADEQGDFETALQLYERSHAICQAIHDQNGAAIALLNMGVVNDRCGNHRPARDLFQQTLEVFRELNDQGSIAVCLINLGNVSLNLEDHAEAAGHFVAALQIAHQLGDRGITTYNWKD